MLNTALPHTCDVDFGTKVRPISARPAAAVASRDSSSESPSSGGVHDDDVDGARDSAGSSSSPASSSNDNSELRFVMTCVRSLPSGAQVHDSYGLKSNDRFLMSYGFSLEDNVR
jgi:hypothetical protein